MKFRPTQILGRQKEKPSYSYFWHSSFFRSVGQCLHHHHHSHHHLLGDCLQLASENVHHHVERVEREPRSEEDHTHLVPKTMNLVFQNIRDSYKKYQVHKRVNTLTAINSRFVRRLRANFRASLREPTRKSRSHSTKGVAIAHHNLYICTYERRKANPALQRATNRP